MDGCFILFHANTTWTTDCNETSYIDSLKSRTIHKLLLYPYVSIESEKNRMKSRGIAHQFVIYDERTDFICKYTYFAQIF